MCVFCSHCCANLVFDFDFLYPVCLEAESAVNAQNVALYRRTYQSSDSDNSTTSDLAVDDNATTCSVTGRQKGANWTVVLDSILPISKIKMNLGLKCSFLSIYQFI